MLKTPLKRFFSALKIENPYTFEVNPSQTVSEVPYTSYSEGVKQLEEALAFQSSYKSLPIPSRVSILHKALQYFEDVFDT